ncbi:hypothetical protein EDC04DRAFT_2611638 [Pisolithus marmoratus]|nr:hypothetical protein EDC04DRAFT_2611638 [Pisolithus marmoratus]
MPVTRALKWRETMISQTHSIAVSGTGSWQYDRRGPGFSLSSRMLHRELPVKSVVSVNLPNPSNAMEGLYDFSMFSPVAISDEFHYLVMVADAEELDEILQWLRSVVVCTSQWCNTFAPAVCLPEDMLLLIFEHALPDRDTRMLRTLSQVCHGWQSVILQAPLLWRKALNLTDGSTWFAEVLRRTQAAPLEVFLTLQKTILVMRFPTSSL